MTKRIIIIVILLGSLWAAVVFGVMPLNRTLQAEQTQLAKQEQSLENSQHLVGVLNQLTSQFGSLQSDLEKVEVAIPSKEDLPRMLVEIPRLVSQNGMILANIGFGESKDDPSGYKSTTIGLSVRGTYANMKSLLRALEQNLRLYDVVSLKFGAPQSGIHSFEFMIQGYTTQ